MRVASVATIQLARFDQVREAGVVVRDARPGVLFWEVAADTHAAGTDPASQQAFTFLMLGLHADVDAARRLLADENESAPWFAGARETWRAILQPFRHYGDANYLDRANPGLLFEAMLPAEGPASPVVVVTTAGWNREGLDMNRVRDFADGIKAVRTAMTGVPGLHTQHSFIFPGVVDLDQPTVTFWHDEASVRTFAYGPGSHRRQLDRHRAEKMSDRTSFTRFRVLESSGTWHGLHAVRFA